MTSARKIGRNGEGSSRVVIQDNIPAFVRIGLKKTRQPVFGSKFEPGTYRMRCGNSGYQPVTYIVGKKFQQSENLLVEEYLLSVCVRWS